MPTSFLKGLKEAQVYPNQESSPKVPLLCSCEQAKSLTSQSCPYWSQWKPCTSQMLSLREQGSLKSGRNFKPWSLEMEKWTSWNHIILKQTNFNSINKITDSLRNTRSYSSFPKMAKGNGPGAPPCCTQFSQECVFCPVPGFTLHSAPSLPSGQSTVCLPFGSPVNI